MEGDAADCDAEERYALRSADLVKACGLRRTVEAVSSTHRLYDKSGEKTELLQKDVFFSAFTSACDEIVGVAPRVEWGQNAGGNVACRIQGEVVTHTFVFSPSRPAAINVAVETDLAADDSATDAEEKRKAWLMALALGAAISRSVAIICRAGAMKALYELQSEARGGIIHHKTDCFAPVLRCPVGSLPIRLAQFAAFENGPSPCALVFPSDAMIEACCRRVPPTLAFRCARTTPPSPRKEDDEDKQEDEEEEEEKSDPRPDVLLWLQGTDKTFASVPPGVEIVHPRAGGGCVLL